MTSVSEWDSVGRSRLLIYWSKASGIAFTRRRWEPERKRVELVKLMGPLVTWRMLEWKVLASSITAVPSPIS